MAKVYSAVPGLKVMIQGYGVATVDEPVTVPDDVARDVEKDKRLRVEKDEAAPRLAPKLKPKEKE
jgi:hypothetical protein